MSPSCTQTIGTCRPSAVRSSISTHFDSPASGVSRTIDDIETLRHFHADGRGAALHLSGDGYGDRAVLLSLFDQIREFFRWIFVEQVGDDQSVARGRSCTPQRVWRA